MTEQLSLTVYLQLQCSHQLGPSLPSGPDPDRDQEASPEPGGFPRHSSGTDGSS